MAPECGIVGRDSQPDMHDVALAGSAGTPSAQLAPTRPGDDTLLTRHGLVERVLKGGRGAPQGVRWHFGAAAHPGRDTPGS
jgi:hypothetical protein